MDSYHLHVTLDVINEEPDTTDVHTLQRRIWCINDLDRREALRLAEQLGGEVSDVQGQITDRAAGAHRG